VQDFLGMFLAIGGLSFIFLHQHLFSFYHLLLSFILPKKSISRPSINHDKKNLHLSHTSPAEIKKGLIAALITSFFWGLNSFAIFYGGQSLHNAFTNAFRLSVAGFLIFLLLTFFKKPLSLPPKSPYLFQKSDYKIFFFFIVLEAFGGSFLYVHGMANSSIEIGATFSSLAPLFSIPLAIALKQESFSWIKTLGIVMIVLGGILLVT
jgi:drug/metabolite transporter (DMT)-like permease